MSSCNVYVAKQRLGERVYASVTRFLENKMRLKVNKEKSKVDKPRNRKFPGFSFYGEKGGVGIRIAPARLERVYKKVKALCRQGRGWNLGRFIKELVYPYPLLPSMPKNIWRRNAALAKAGRSRAKTIKLVRITEPGRKPGFVICKAYRRLPCS